MAYDVLQDLYMSTEDLLVERPQLANDIPEIKEFLAYAKRKEEVYKTNRRNFVLKLAEVEGETLKMVKGFKKYYVAPEPKPSESTSKNDGKKEQVTAVTEPTANPDTNKAPVRKAPRDVQDFLEHIVQVLNAGNITIFQCKRPVSDLGVDFQALAGLEYEKEQLRLGYIYPLKFKSLFPGASRGVLLYGPPGTGKTMLAKAATKELADAAFFSATPGQIKDKFVGGTQKNIRNLFACAGEFVEKKPNRYKMAVIFMDEFEGLGGDREAGDTHDADSVQEFLQNMDGINSNAKVSVLAATNYPWRLDDAIIRRFDSFIFVDLPDATARMGIILSVLVNAYSLPGTESIDKKVYMITLTTTNTQSGPDENGEEVEHEVKEHSQDWNPAVYDMMDNLKNYGPIAAQEIDKSKSTFMSKVYTRVEKPQLTWENLRYLVALTGPKPAAADDMKKRKGKPGEFHTDAKSLYGYSSSDLSKVVNKAIAIASARVVANKEDDLFYKKNFKDQAYWIYDSSGKYETTQKKSLRDIERDDIAKIRAWTNAGKFDEIRRYSREADRVVSFAISWDDITKALDMNPSTIKEDKYKQLLNWVPSQ